MTSISPSTDVKTVPSDVTLRVHPAHGGLIGQLTTPSPSSSASSTASLPFKKGFAHDGLLTVVILDRSGSMGDQVSRMLLRILPDWMAALGYAPEESIHLVMFDTQVILEEWTASQMQRSTIGCGGGTTMSVAVTSVLSLLEHFFDKAERMGQPPLRSLRLLTISDGELQDQEATLQASTLLKEALMRPTTQLRVNSQAVRLFTSTCQPDTQGLSSVMRLSSTTSTLTDVQARQSDSTIVSQLVRLFQEDGLRNALTLHSAEPLLKSSPWATPSTTLTLVPGENTFWLSEMPTHLTLGDTNIPVQVELGDALSSSTQGPMLGKTVAFFMHRLKVLKIINTPEARTEMDCILQYWTELDKSLMASDSTMTSLITSSRGLSGRLQFFKALVERSSRSLSARMREVANDDRVAQLNSAQQADYLRDVTVGRNTRALARRALTSDSTLDFDSVARSEVRAMREHLSELQDLDDSDHQVSFYSLETTLAGVKAVCGLADEGILDEVSVHDIMRLLNIVGVPVDALIGDYPDPMTYRTNAVFHGAYVSLADVLTAYLTSANGEDGVGGSLYAPGWGQDRPIINVIPVYDDERIHLFLRKYAPRLLEFIASVGMRRVIAEVPHTYLYTLCAGVWQLVKDLNEQSPPSELLSHLFVKLTRTFQSAAGPYFNHILPYLESPTHRDELPRRSFYLGKNGVTNLIIPLLNSMTRREGQFDHLDLPAILRALYSFEVWQVVRKRYRHQQDAAEVLRGFLHTLLGINLEGEHRTPVTALFEKDDRTPALYDQHTVDEVALTDLLRQGWFINYLTLLPAYLQASLAPTLSEATSQIRAVAKMSDTTIQHALGIDYDLRTFQLYSVVQALLYSTSQSRVNEDECQSKFIDVVDQQVAEQMVREYVRLEFERQFNKDLVAKHRTERQELCDELVQQIVASESVEDIKRLFRQGLSRGDCAVVFSNTSSQGFAQLYDALLLQTLRVPLRLVKLSFLLLGIDLNNPADTAPVFNNGNVLMMAHLPTFRGVFQQEQEDGLAVWSSVEANFRSRRSHVYGREKPNQHGHSNAKPSYWALGYPTLEEFVQGVSQSEWDEYREVHHDCCGVAVFTGKPWGRQQRKQTREARRKASAAWKAP